MLLFNLTLQFAGFVYKCYKFEGGWIERGEGWRRGRKRRDEEIRDRMRVEERKSSSYKRENDT